MLFVFWGGVYVSTYKLARVRVVRTWVHAWVRTCTRVPTGMSCLCVVIVMDGSGERAVCAEACCTS